MSRKLVETLDAALAAAGQNRPAPDASVMVQFAAGDLAKIYAALDEARAEQPPTPVSGTTTVSSKKGTK